MTSNGCEIFQKGGKTMTEKNQVTGESMEMKGRRIKVGRLQRTRESVRDLTSGEQKRVKGGVVISIIGILVGTRSTADQR
jgi:hypothetical protein